MSSDDDRLTAELKAAVEEHEQAVDALGTFLEQTRSNARAVVEHICSGHSVARALDVEHVSKHRDAYGAHMEAFDGSRKRLRLLLLRWAVTHGESASRIAPGLGVSRQFAVRIAREARELCPTKAEIRSAHASTT